MIFGRTKLELKVGVFVFVGLIILGVFVLKIGGYKTMVSGQRVNFVFNFTNGIKTGAPIRFAGVDVGEVKEIRFIPTQAGDRTQVQLVGWVRREVKIPADSSVWVNTLGLLGEKYVEIMPGKDYANILRDNATVIGNDPLAMQEIGIILKDIANSIETLLAKIQSNEGTLGRLLYDASLYEELEKSVVTLRDTLQSQIVGVGEQLEDLISEIRRHPWKLFWKSKETR